MSRRWAEPVHLAIWVVKFIFGSAYETTEKQRLEPQSRCSLVEHWLISSGRAIAEPML